MARPTYTALWQTAQALRSRERRPGEDGECGLHGEVAAGLEEWFVDVTG